MVPPVTKNPESTIAASCSAKSLFFPWTRNLNSSELKNDIPENCGFKGTKKIFYHKMNDPLYSQGTILLICLEFTNEEFNLVCTLGV